MNGISCETGGAVFIALVLNHHIAGLYFFLSREILILISNCMDSACNQGRDIMAKSYYQFKKRQKELDKKKKKEAKRQRKLESKMLETHETDDTENDPSPSTDNP